MERLPAYLKNPSMGAARSVFPICPKDNTLPKCDGCHRLFNSGDCPLGRSYPKEKTMRVFNKYALATGGSDDECEDILERIRNMDMPKATMPDPNSAYLKDIRKKHWKTKTGFTHLKKP